MKKFIRLFLDNFTLPPSFFSVIALLLSTRFGEWTLYTEHERFLLTLWAALFITGADVLRNIISLIVFWKKNIRNEQQQRAE